MKINLIKTRLAFSFLILFSYSLEAQIPKLVSYQGFLTNTSGAALVDGNYNITVKIFDAQSGGNELWSENHSVSLMNGYFSVALGSNNTLNLAFDRAYFVSTTVDGNELLPRTAMTASPYALNAPSAGGSNGKAYALDAFDGSKVDVVQVDSDGNVGINSTPIFGNLLTMNTGPSNIAGISLINTFSDDPNLTPIGIGAVATGNSKRGIGGRFTGTSTGLIGTVSAASDSDDPGIGVQGTSSRRGSSDVASNIGVRGIGTGTSGIGVQGIGGGIGTRNIGLWGEVANDAQLNYAIYGEAPLTPTSFAGYFDGNINVKYNIGVGINNLFAPSGDGLMLRDGRGGLEFYAADNKSSISMPFGSSLEVNPFSDFVVKGQTRVVAETESIAALGVQGNNWGANIYLAKQTNADDRFISFGDFDGDQGSITGSTSFGDLDLGGRLSSFLSGIFIPKSGAPTTAQFTLFPPVDEDWSSSTGANKTNDINNADTNDFGTVLANFAGDRVNAEFLIESILLSIDVAENAVAFASSFGSVLDPEDIFSSGLDLVISGVNLGVFLGYAIAADGVAYNSGAGDYAEWLVRTDSNEMITFGDIVGLRAGEISTNFLEADHFMAISTAPAVVGATPAAANQHLYEKVAFMGQVPVKVRGFVNKGDYIVPSGDGDGLGIAVNPKDMLAKDYHRIVGIAWDESDGKELFKMINTAVGINQNDLANIVDQMQTTMNNMQLAIKEMNPDFEMNLFATDGGQKAPQNNDLGYTVSSSHSSKTAGLFGGQQFSSMEEAKVAIKDAWTQTAQLDLEQNNFLAYMLDHPEEAPAMIQHYTGAIDQLQSLAKQIQIQLIGDE